jgi:hypothetical protein
MSALWKAPQRGEVQQVRMMPARLAVNEAMDVPPQIWHRFLAIGQDLKRRYC